VAAAIDVVLTPKQLSQRIERSEHTLYLWRAAGKGPGWFKLGVSVFYDLSEVERWERATGRAA
jgi:hypothetical protein